jgi:hypothetical protein
MAHSMSTAVASFGDDPFGSSLVLQKPSLAKLCDPVTSDAILAPMPLDTLLDYAIIEAAFSIGTLDLDAPMSKADIAKPESGYSTKAAIAALFGTI